MPDPTRVPVHPIDALIRDLFRKKPRGTDGITGTGYLPPEVLEANRRDTAPQRIQLDSRPFILLPEAGEPHDRRFTTYPGAGISKTDPIRRELIDPRAGRQLYLWGRQPGKTFTLKNLQCCNSLMTWDRGRALWVCRTCGRTATPGGTL